MEVVLLLVGKRNNREKKTTKMQIRLSLWKCEKFGNYEKKILEDNNNSIGSYV